jgi:hypothetical protein
MSAAARSRPCSRSSWPARRRWRRTAPPCLRGRFRAQHAARRHSHNGARTPKAAACEGGHRLTRPRRRQRRERVALLVDALPQVL